MFEHLDDPQPFVASDGLRASVVAAGGRMRRRRRRRVLGGGAVACAVAVAAAGWAYVDRRDAAIDRVEVATQPSVDGAVNILLLGDDGDLAAASPEVTGSRIDTAVVLRLDDTGAHLLSIPRDLADPASDERFNALASGDLQVAVDAVHAVVGAVPIDHVIRLGFDGFVALVDAVGGIPVRVLQPIVDEPTGTQLQIVGGCQVLDGPTALGLVRARHVDGDPTGDLGRTARQRVLLEAAVAAADVVEIDAVSRVVADHAVVDDDLDLATMLDLGRRLASATSVESVELPVRSDVRSDGAVVFRLAEGAGPVLARFGAPGPSPVPTDALPSDHTEVPTYLAPC